jgi:hypothetical protein
VEGIEQQRMMMITALFQNPNWDGEENVAKRTSQIESYNEHFNKAIELVYHPERAEPDIDWSNPFWAAAKRGLEKTRQRLGLSDKSLSTLRETTTEQDQERIKARLEARKSIDQV